MCEWSQHSLREPVGSPISGSRPSGGVREDTAGIPSLGGENILIDGGVTFDVLKRIPRKFFALMTKGHLQAGDVLINKDGAQTGKVGFYEGAFEEAAINEHLFILRSTNGSVNQRLLYYYLLHRDTQRSIARMITGSAQPGLNSKFVDSVRISLPTSDAEQQRIAGALETIDTAIQESDAIIAKLKIVRQGLLYDLLTRGIDANGEIRPHQADAAHLYKLSPTGWIPNDWVSGPLACWLDGKPENGYSPQEAGEWTGIQMLGLGCLTLQGFQPLQLKPAPRGDKRLSSALLSDGDLLMSRANTRDLVGMVGVYRDVGTPCTYPDLMMRLRPSTETSAEFLQFVLQASAVRRQVQAHAVGTSGSMVKISGKIVSNLVVAIPSKTEQNQILALLAAGDAQLNSELEKLAVLRELKAGLMDDLLTGRVRVTPLLAEAAQQAGSA